MKVFTFKSDDYATTAIDFLPVAEILRSDIT